MESKGLLRLQGRTLRGKNKIREAGTDLWEVLLISQHVPCLNNDVGYLVAPQGAVNGQYKSRWIKKVGDDHFAITEIVEKTGEPTC